MWIQHQTGFISTKSRCEAMVTQCRAYLFWKYILQDLKLMPIWTSVSKQAWLFFMFIDSVAKKQQSTCLHATHASPCPLSVFQEVQNIFRLGFFLQGHSSYQFLMSKRIYLVPFFFFFFSMIKYITGNVFILRDHIIFQAQFVLNLAVFELQRKVLPVVSA